MSVESNQNHKKWRKVIYLIVAMIVFSAACTSSKVTDLQAPPDSVETKSTLEVGKQLDSVERKILLFIKENGYKNADSKIRLLDKSATMQEIGKFYDDQLVKLGFTKESSPELKPENAETTIWKKRESFGEQIIIVSVIENRHAETNELTNKTLLTYTAGK